MRTACQSIPVEWEILYYRPKIDFDWVENKGKRVMMSLMVSTIGGGQEQTDFV